MTAAALSTGAFFARPRATRTINWKKFTTPVLIGLGLFATLLLIDAILGSSFAQQDGDQAFTNMSDKATDFFYNGRSVILIVCAIGVIATMATALSGRFPMQKAIVLAFAIIVIAVASSIVTYFASAGETATGTTVPSETDTGTAG